MENAPNKKSDETLSPESSEALWNGVSPGLYQNLIKVIDGEEISEDLGDLGLLAEDESEGKLEKMGGAGVSEERFSKKTEAAFFELQKQGMIEASLKPVLYQDARAAFGELSKHFTYLRLSLKLDDVRGLIYLEVAESFIAEGGDSWSHPLVTKQRFTTEQSLLLAILRQKFLTLENETGANGPKVVIFIEIYQILLHYLGDSGSDDKNRRKVEQLIEKLRPYGIVSEIRADGTFLVRPIITKVLNPESLTALLAHYSSLGLGEDAADD